MFMQLDVCWFHLNLTVLLSHLGTPLSLVHLESGPYQILLDLSGHYWASVYQDYLFHCFWGLFHVENNGLLFKRRMCSGILTMLYTITIKWPGIALLVGLPYMYIQLHKMICLNILVICTT